MDNASYQSGISGMFAVGKCQFDNYQNTSDGFQKHHKSVGIGNGIDDSDVGFGNQKQIQYNESKTPKYAVAVTNVKQ